MKRFTGKFPKWRDAVLSPEDDATPSDEAELTGPWALDPFMGCDFMTASHSAPEVFGRSLSESAQETEIAALVEPDGAIMNAPGYPEPNESTGEVRFLTMWMRIEEEQRRRAREASAD